MLRRNARSARLVALAGLTLAAVTFGERAARSQVFAETSGLIDAILPPQPEATLEVPARNFIYAGDRLFSAWELPADESGRCEAQLPPIPNSPGACAGLTERTAFEHVPGPGNPLGTLAHAKCVVASGFGNFAGADARLTSEMWSAYAHGANGEALTAAGRLVACGPPPSVSLVNVGVLCRGLGDDVRARILLEQAVERTRAHTDANAAVANAALLQLVGLDIEEGQLQRAHETLSRLSTSAVDENATSVSLLEGALELAEGRVDDAQIRLDAISGDSAIDASERGTSTKAEVELARGDLARHRADLAAAEMHYRSVLRALDTAPEIHVPTGSAQSHLANVSKRTHLKRLATRRLVTLAFDRGDFATGESQIEGALAQNSSPGSIPDPMVGLLHNDLGLAVYGRGNFAEARDRFDTAARLLAAAHSDRDWRVAAALTNRATVERALGLRACANDTLGAAHKIWENEPLRSALAATYGAVARADWMRSRGQFDAARRVLERALAWRTTHGEQETTGSGALLNDLADIKMRLGDLAGARAGFRDALRLFTERQDERHPSVATVRSNLAAVAWLRHDDDEALDEAAAAAKIRERSLSLVLANGREAERRQYLESLTAETAAILSLQGSSAPRDEATALALTTILRRKGRLIDSVVRERAWRASSGDQETMGIMKELSTLRARLAHALLRESDSESDVEALERRVNDIDRKIQKRGTPQIGGEAVTIAQVQEVIPKKAALIEFYRYAPLMPRADSTGFDMGRPHYVAYILKHRGRPARLDLGTADQIESAVEEWFPRRYDSKAFVAQSEVLGSLLLSPLAPHLDGVSLLLIAPDGRLNGLPFSALIDQEMLVLRRYASTYLTSGREILDFVKPLPARSRAALVVYPEDGGFADEADALKRLLTPDAVLVGSAATTAGVKAQKAPQILHIAAHGEYSPSATAEAPELAMARVRLALAPPRDADASGQDDNLLTALEVADLDLHGTQLVVVSACDSGLGVVRNGEGVYGLRRGFAAAGARSQLTSLWKVSSSTTPDLMKHYYEGLLDEGLGTAEALRQAQLVFLNDERTRAPVHWAAFVSMGDWRPIRSWRSGVLSGCN